MDKVFSNLKMKYILKQLNNLHPELDAVVSGKEKDWRHEMFYEKGDFNKRMQRINDIDAENINLPVTQKTFGEIINVLQTWYSEQPCKYIEKVLVPRCFTMLIKRTMKISIEQAEFYLKNSNISTGEHIVKLWSEKARKKISQEEQVSNLNERKLYPKRINTKQKSEIYTQAPIEDETDVILPSDVENEDEDRPKSILRKKLFSNSEILVLRSKCSEIIKGGKVVRDRVNTALKDTSLLKHFAFTQLRTRIMYERQLLQ